MNSKPAEWPNYLEASKKGQKLIVVDPRLTKIATMANIHLQLRPGSDGALALGLMNVIINENLYDKEFINNWTVGFEGLKSLVRKYSPEYVEKVTWVPADKIRKAAIVFATVKPARIVTTANSTTHHANGLQNHRAIILLPTLTGNVKVPTVDLTSNPAINDITLHERVANMPPGIGSQRLPIGQSKSTRCSPMRWRIKLTRLILTLSKLSFQPVWISNFCQFRSDGESLKKLDFIAVTEYFQTPATQLADVIFPIASWLERPILQTQSGYIKLIEPAIDPIGESWSEWKIYSELAKRLGFGEQFWMVILKNALTLFLNRWHYI